MDVTAEQIELKKKYLDNEIENVLDLISINRSNLSILGSYGLRSSWFPSDVDCQETVSYNKNTVKNIQQIIKNVNKNNNLFITDIKLGNIKEYEIVKDNAYVISPRGKRGVPAIYNYNQIDSREKLKKIRNFVPKPLSAEEYNKWNKMLIKKPTQVQLIEIQKEVRPNLMRWTPDEVLRNLKTYRGQKYTILDAIKTGGLFKIDFVFIKSNCEFIDINIVYDIRMKGLRSDSSPLLNIRVELKREIDNLIIQGKYFKALKRMFSLAKIRNSVPEPLSVKGGRNPQIEANKKLIVKLYKILNSSIGILHQISGNCEILILLLEQNKRIPLDKLKCFINEFIGRLNNVFSINQYIKQERFIINKINKIINSNSKTTILNNLNILKDKLDLIKNNASKKYISIVYK